MAHSASGLRPLSRLRGRVGQGASAAPQIRTSKGFTKLNRRGPLPDPPPRAREGEGSVALWVLNRPDGGDLSDKRGRLIQDGGAVHFQNRNIAVGVVPQN